MAKQPSTEQLNVMLTDLMVTSQTSEFPEVRKVAQEMVPVLNKFLNLVIHYRKITD